MTFLRHRRRRFMRRLKLADVRLARYGRHQVVAAPCWAYEPYEFGGRIYHRKIEAAWAPLLATLRRRAEKRAAEAKAAWERTLHTATDPNASAWERDEARYFVSLRKALS